MKRALLFASVLVVLAGCASTHSASRGGAQPVNVVVTANAPLRQADADLFRRITEGYVRRYVHSAQPLNVSVTLGRAAQIMARHDVASMGGYWQIESSYSIPTGHPVALAGGTYPNVGFLPTVSTGGEGIGAGAGYMPDFGGVGVGAYGRYFASMLCASYTITDRSGKTIESDVLPLSNVGVSFVGWRLQDYHDSGMYIAKRVAKVQ